MSYEQREVNYVGRHFEDNDELLELLLSTNAISQELADTWAEDLEAGERISNLLGPNDIAIPNFPDLQDVDSVSGDGGMFLGYVIETQFVSQEVFDQKVEEAKKQWKAIFNEDAELEWVMQYY